MWFAMAWIIVGAALQCSSYGTGQLLAARFITGIGTGIETSTVPMYQAELSKAHQRGRLVCSEPLFVGVGIVIAYWFDYGMNYHSGAIAWRLPIACQMIFAFVVIVLVFGLPESPRYLYNKGRHAEGLQVLCDVYEKDPSHPEIVKEQADILAAIELESHSQTSWWSLFKQDEIQTGKRVLLAYGMQFMNQVSLINRLEGSAGADESGRRYQFGRLLCPYGSPNERWPLSQSCSASRRRHSMHVRHRLLCASPTRRQDRSPCSNDVGISWSQYLHAVDLSPAEFQRYFCPEGDFDCQCRFLLYLYACEYRHLADNIVKVLTNISDIRRLGELHTMVLRARDLALESQGKRHRSRHLQQLALGTQTSASLIPYLILMSSNRTSSSS